MSPGDRGREVRRHAMPRLRTIVAGMEERDLRLLLMVAAYEARECPDESPDRIARTLIQTLETDR